MERKAFTNLMEASARVLLGETHMIGKTVIVKGKKGKVVKQVSSDGKTESDEIYQVKFEDGTVEDIPARDMEMQGDTENRKEPSENEAEDIVNSESVEVDEKWQGGGGIDDFSLSTKYGGKPYQGAEYNPKKKTKKPMFTKRTKKMTPEEEQAALDFYTRQGKPLKKIFPRKKKNESAELDEGRMKEIDIRRKEGETPEQIAKGMKVNVKDVKHVLRGRRESPHERLAAAIDRIKASHESVEIEEKFTIVGYNKKGKKVGGYTALGQRDADSASNTLKKDFGASKVEIKSSGGDKTESFEIEEGGKDVVKIGKPITIGLDIKNPIKVGKGKKKKLKADEPPSKDLLDTITKIVTDYNTGAIYKEEVELEESYDKKGLLKKDLTHAVHSKGPDGQIHFTTRSKKMAQFKAKMYTDAIQWTKKTHPGFDIKIVPHGTPNGKSVHKDHERYYGKTDESVSKDIRV